MSNNDFYSKLAARERIWETAKTCLHTSIFALLATAYQSAAPETYTDFLAYGFFALSFLWLGFTSIRFVQSLLVDTLLSPYWIEDCGQVVRVRGVIPTNGKDLAIRRLLKGKCGYKIVEKSEGALCPIVAIQQ